MQAKNAGQIVHYNFTQLRLQIKKSSLNPLILQTLKQLNREF